MADVENAYFDELFQGYGAEIIQETKFCTYSNTHILNGTRETLLELGE